MCGSMFKFIHWSCRGLVSVPSTHTGSSQLPKTFVLEVLMVFSVHYKNINLCGALTDNHIYAELKQTNKY